MLGRDVDVAATSADIHVSATGGDRNGRLARQRNVEINFCMIVARALGHGVERDQATNGCNLRLGLSVELVGLLLILGAYALADHDRDLVIVRGVDADGSVIVDHLEAGVGRKSLFEMIVEVEAFAEDAGEVAIVPNLLT